MNKLTKYIAMFLWAVIALFSLYYFFFPKSQDPQVLNQSLVGVCNEYLGDRDVKVNAVRGDGNYFDLIRAFGTFLAEKQVVEKKLAGETKVIMNMVSPNNLANASSVDATLAKIEAYPKLVEESSKAVADAVAKYNKSFADLIDPDDKMVGPTSIFRKAEKSLQANENQTKIRVALAQYVKALLDFVKSRNGYFQVTDNKLVFSTPEDQAYFDQLYATTYEINKKLEDALSTERIEFRQDMSTIKL